MSSLSQGPFNHNRFAAIDEFYAREKQYFMEKAKAKKLDPVGKEDADVDNDGDVDSSDSYLKKRREAIGKAMGKDKGKKDMKESSCSPGCDCDDCKKRSKKKEMKENRFAAYGGKDTDAGAKYAKPSKGGSKKGVYTMKGKDGKPLFGEEVSLEDAIIEYLMDHGYANNPVSAEVVRRHMSENWLNDVANELEEGYGKKKKKA